ncbi:MAG: methyltransferase domain-containing protein [Desulfomonilaceae bacterium]
MDQGKITKIKNAVLGNFEQSPVHYQSFEDRHGFFRRLNEALLSGMTLRADADILDVGCGTGASCLQLLEAMPECRVWGLDLSPAMLDAARSRIDERERLSLVEGDGAKLSDYFTCRFDAIIYSASIFLIPDFQHSLRHAHDLLKKDGKIGLTFMDGLYDPAGNNLLEIADRRAKEGVSLRKPVNWPEFQSFFAGMFPRHKSWKEDFRLPKDLLCEFFSVPAMSAGLFPGTEYSARVTKVARLLEHLPQGETLFRWSLMVGERSESV